ncbi:MAG: nuclear transport factor 2 family protein [Actinomycetota bacterium]
MEDKRHPHEALIERFYSAFQRRDAEAMVACYHPDIEFSDDVFGRLKGAEARAMWRMLCARGKDLRVEYRDITANDNSGSAHWEATYTFSGSGRSVHNVIEARFEFSDGLISRHHDRFDFARWAGQALGLPGKLLGRTSFFRNAVRRKTRTALDEFLKNT